MDCHERTRRPPGLHGRDSYSGAYRSSADYSLLGDADSNSDSHGNDDSEPQCSGNTGASDLPNLGRFRDTGGNTDIRASNNNFITDGNEPIDHVSTYPAPTMTPIDCCPGGPA